MLIRARAPLRLGLAGGGTDLSPFCDEHGGAILNATIGLYAYATLEPLEGGRVIFETRDTGQTVEYPADAAQMPGDGRLDLHRAVYRRIVNDFRRGEPYPCRLTTYCDAPPGSGLGSSSTLVVDARRRDVAGGRRGSRPADRRIRHTYKTRFARASKCSRRYSADAPLPAR